LPGRILIVDDNSDARETLADLLRMMDYEVRVAGDGAAAMALLDEYQPQLALLDIGLPGEDGYALAGRMRAHPGAAGTKLVALSGYGRDRERSQATGAQFDDHLIKPVGADDLLDIVQKMIG
jgi:CheY-like chemotaxis protein